MTKCKIFLTVLALLCALSSLSALVAAQDSATVLASAELSQVVPSGFYFQGLSAPTQLRNSAAVRFGTNRYVITGMVDTSGYAADVRAKYEGFLITDSLITVGGSDLSTGAYGFGFSDNGRLNIFDLSGKEVLSVATTKDSGLRRPRPLMMTKAADGIRLYSGRDYVLIVAK